MSLVSLSLEEAVPLLPALACWSKIGIDRAPDGTFVRTRRDGAREAPQFSRATNGARNSRKTGDHFGVLGTAGGMAEVAVELEIARLDAGRGQRLDDIRRDLWWKQRVGAAATPPASIISTWRG